MLRRATALLRPAQGSLQTRNAGNSGVQKNWFVEVRALRFVDGSSLLNPAYLCPPGVERQA
jgi:hypothetical protein